MTPAQIYLMSVLFTTISLARAHSIFSINICYGGWIDGKMDRELVARMDGFMDGWMVRWIDRWVDGSKVSILPKPLSQGLLTFQLSAVREHREGGNIGGFLLYYSFSYSRIP